MPPEKAYSDGDIARLNPATRWFASKRPLGLGYNRGTLRKTGGVCSVEGPGHVS